MVIVPNIGKRMLITSALPYVNNVPHLGNIIGCVLSADVFARFQRSAGRETLFICGTDEHGTTTEKKAREEGVSPQEICDKYYKIHKDVYDWFNIKFDHFGRTSLPNHAIRTQELFKALDKEGFVKQEIIKQLYSQSSKTFLADRYVEGTCPYCDFPDARGDQCDGCGKLLSPLELKNPRSALDGDVPELKETEHLFLDLPKLQDELKHWVGSQSELGAWSENAIRTTMAWFKEGLQPRAITRDLNWGVSVPKEGFEDKVFYVWFDAPIGYISITEQLLGDDWTKWWQAPDDVLLYQFMAKDNIPFHTILFPATLIGSRGFWTKLHHINSTEYLNYEDKKFSKSHGTGVFGDTAQDTGIPADVWRYYLLVNRPETADTKFLWDDFHDKLNNELVANIGNFVNRTTTFIARHCGGKVLDRQLSEENKSFRDKVNTEAQLVTELLEEVHLKDALKKVMHISKLGNQYFQEQAPWKTIKEDVRVAEESMFVLANLVKDLAILIEPFLPATAANIFSQLNIEPKSWSDLGCLSVAEQDIGEPSLLFEKIDDKKLEELKNRFDGKDEVAHASANEKKEFTPAHLDLRVAKITRVEKHPKADKLYIEELDVGELGSRTIVSGLVGHYAPEELAGQQIVLVSNLKTATLRGVESAGMLLAAESNGKVRILTVPDELGKPGDKVVIDGVNAVDFGEFTIDEFFSLKLEVKDFTPRINTHALLVNGKPLMAEVQNGTIR